MSRQKSILLQVAFKAAIELVGEADYEKIGEVTHNLYTLLSNLHDKLGIGEEETAGTPTSDEAPVVTIDGEKWYDYRGIKELGGVPANFPDFKRVSDGQGKWLTTKSGNPTKFAALVEAAGV